VPDALLSGWLLAHAAHGPEKEEDTRKQSNQHNAGNGNHENSPDR
jgi:hypothetical protein